MIDMKFSLTEMEQEILEYLWNSRSWTSGAEFWKLLNDRGRECKRQTVNTYLSRMADKGLLIRDGKKYMYAYNREEFDSEKADELLHSMYGGTIKNFVAALTGGNKIKKEDADELKKYLDSLK